MFAKALVLGISLTILAAVGCGPVGGNGESVLDGSDDSTAVSSIDREFATAVALPQKSYDVYWFGEEFEAGGATWRGPDVASIGHEADEDGLEMGYYPGIPGSGIDVRLVGGDRCLAAQADFAMDLATALTSREVVVGTLTGTMIKVPGGPRKPVQYVGALFESGGTCIRVTAGSGGTLTEGGPDVNPALDEQVFLEALQNLRPYPE